MLRARAQAYPDIAKAHAREAKLQAAAAAGPATFGAANVVVGHVDEVEPVDGHAGLFKAMMALGNGKQVPVASALLRASECLSCRARLIFFVVVVWCFSKTLTTLCC